MPAVARAEPIKIATPPYAYEKHKAIIQEKNTSPHAITEFESPHSSRVMVDLLLIVQALHLGGCKDDVEFVFSQNHARNLHKVKCGNLHILGQETWEEGVDETVYKSVPIVRHGEFKKALIQCGFLPDENTDSDRTLP